MFALNHLSPSSTPPFFSHSHFTNLVFSFPLYVFSLLAYGFLAHPLVAVLVCVGSALFVDLGVGLVILQTKQVLIF